MIEAEVKYIYKRVFEMRDGVSQVEPPQLLGGVGFVIKHSEADGDWAHRYPISRPATLMQRQTKAIERLLDIQSRSNCDQACRAQRDKLSA